MKIVSNIRVIGLVFLLFVVSSGCVTPIYADNFEVINSSIEKNDECTILLLDMKYSGTSENPTIQFKTRLMNNQSIVSEWKYEYDTFDRNRVEKVVFRFCGDKPHSTANTFEWKITSGLKDN